MTTAAISLILTYAIAGTIGYIVAKKVRNKPPRTGWILLIVMTILSQWILPGTRLIVIFQFEMYANYLLQAFFGGVLAGLSLRK